MALFESNTDITPGGSGLRVGAIAFAVIVPLWLIAFITGLAPWLGSRDFEFRAGTLSASSQSGFGTQTMLLFKGQTAYIDYSVKGDTERAIRLDISPSPAIAFSPAAKLAEAGEAGRLEVPIASTGFYRFRFDPDAGSYRKTMAYHVSWGAK